MNKAKRKEMYELQLHAYQNQLEILQDVNERYRTLRHDMKHHIVLLTDLICKGENEKALEYLEKISSYAGTRRNYVETGNTGADSILNYMTEKVKNISGQIQTDICIPPELAIDDFDMSVILGNLLSNAYEAMKSCPEKELTITLKYDRGVLFICIENTYDGRLVRENGKIVTRKEDVFEHGMGLESVRKTIKKYDGSLEVCFDEKRFRAEVILYTELID